MIPTSFKIVSLIALAFIFTPHDSQASNSKTSVAPVAPAMTDQEVNLSIEGMHCGGCKKMITKTVCEDKELSQQFENCSVSLVDPAKQLGQISLKMKPGHAMDLKAIEAAVKKAGDDYKVVTPNKPK